MGGGDGMKSITRPKYNDVEIKSDAKIEHPGKREASNDRASGGLGIISHANT